MLSEGSALVGGVEFALHDSIFGNEFDPPQQLIAVFQDERQHGAACVIVGTLVNKDQPLD